MWVNRKRFPPQWIFSNFLVTKPAYNVSRPRYNTLKGLFGYSQNTWIGWDWKKMRRGLTCLGFKPIQSHSIHMD
jgi:hypothetical protein